MVTKLPGGDSDSHCIPIKNKLTKSVEEISTKAHPQTILVERVSVRLKTKFRSKPGAANTNRAVFTDDAEP